MADDWVGDDLPMPPQPAWTGDDEAMYRWCFAMLEKELEEKDVHDEEWIRENNAYVRACVAFQQGNPAPMRELYPHLAEFIHPPPPQRGQHRRPETQTKEFALDLVKRVNALWRKHYGRGQRRQSDGIGAIAIVSRYLDLDETKVGEWVRKG
jgi:hypothetical protein